MAKEVPGREGPLRLDVAEEGELWSARARDWADVQEKFLDPCYLEMLRRTGVEEATLVLDVGCGAGRFLELAAERGARVAGLDAASGMLQIARERIPGGDLRVGDMEALPYGDDSFDLVTGFNSFSHADDPVQALREAARVVKPGGTVALTVWGPAEEGSVRAVVHRVIHSFLSDSDKSNQEDGRGGEEHVHSITADDDLVELVKEAGLNPRATGKIECRFSYPNKGTLLRGLMSPGPFVAAARKAGESVVAEAILNAMEPFKAESGAYSFSNEFRYLIADT